MTQAPRDHGPAEPEPAHRQGATDWDALVARAEVEQPESTAPARSRRLGLRGIAAALLLTLLAGAGVGAWQLTQAPGPSAAERDRGRRALLALIDSSLADHLRVHGSYPDSLQEVLPIQLEVDYRRTADGYVATVHLSDGRPMTVRKP